MHIYVSYYNFKYWTGEHVNKHAIRTAYCYSTRTQLLLTILYFYSLYLFKRNKCNVLIVYLLQMYSWWNNRCNEKSIWWAQSQWSHGEWCIPSGIWREWWDYSSHQQVKHVLFSSVFMCLIFQEFKFSTGSPWLTTACLGKQRQISKRNLHPSFKVPKATPHDLTIAFWVSGNWPIFTAVW